MLPDCRLYSLSRHILYRYCFYGAFYSCHPPFSCFLPRFYNALAGSRALDPVSAILCICFPFFAPGIGSPYGATRSLRRWVSWLRLLVPCRRRPLFDIFYSASIMIWLILGLSCLPYSLYILMMGCMHCMYSCMYVFTCVCVYVCIFIKLHITAQSGPVIRVILCHSH